MNPKMTRKKSVASIALAVSACASAAHAMPMPLPPGATPHPAPPVYTYCLSDYGQYRDGNRHVGDCDEKEKNEMYEAPVTASGCTADQVVIKATHAIQIRSCPTAVQL